ncbi:MAG: fibronectin type III domain-containing protein [Elusimicrobia bacterium]|nr:fibronectin type III domain-containing protein [Elusimicrobiota bacterium]
MPATVIKTIHKPLLKIIQIKSLLLFIILLRIVIAPCFGDGDSTAPGKITGLAAYQGPEANEILLEWVTPGDDDYDGTLQPGSVYKIQHTTDSPDSVSWSTSSAQITISTSGVDPGILVSTSMIFPGNENYYFKAWSQDEEYNWSVISDSASAFNSPFSFETIDDGTYRGEAVDMALDSAGRPHIAYDNLSNFPFYTLLFAKWTGATWDLQTAYDGYSGSGNSVVIDVTGKPYISYGCYIDRNIRLSKWDGTSWSDEVFDQGEMTGVGFSGTSMALDGGGNIHIAYHDNELNELKYAVYNGISWSTSTVDSDGDVGRDPSLALDGAGIPHISYFDATSWDLKYASWTSTGWSIKVIDSLEQTGRYTSIALDADAIPHISYHEPTEGSLKYAKFNGSTWDIEVIHDVSVSYTGYHTSLILDGDGNPHISYYHQELVQDLNYAWYDGINWSTQTVDSKINKNPSGGDGIESSIAINAAGDVLIAYNAENIFDLKLAKWTGAGFAPSMGGNPRGRTQMPDDFVPGFIYYSSITWTWTDSSSNELGFRLYGAATSTGPFSLIADTVTISAGVTSYTETGLLPGTSYFRYLAAVNKGGIVTSSGAAVETATYDITPPSGITNLSALAGQTDCEIQLYWTSPGDDNLADILTGEFRIEYSSWTNTIWSTNTAAGDGYYISITTLNVTPLTTQSRVVTSLQPGIEYYFRIWTADEVNNWSDLSNPATVQASLAPPAVPSDFTGEAQSTASIKWTWSDNTDYEEGFEIRSSTGFVLVSSVTLNADTTIWIQTGLTENASSYVRKVYAVNAQGYSSASDDPPGFPLFTLAMPSSGSYLSDVSSWSITVNWEPNSNPSYTRWGIFRSSDNFQTSTATLKNFSNNYSGTSYPDGELSAYTTYWYKILAYNENGTESDYDEVVSTRTLPGPVIPNAPSGFEGTALSTASIKWSWDITANASYYNIFRADDDFLLENIIINSTTEWIETTGLSPNTQYQRYIKAGNDEGISSPSDIAEEYTLAETPSGLTVNILTAHSIELSWNEDNTQLFRVEYSTNSDFTVYIVSDSITGNISIFTNLLPETIYYFAVYGYNSENIMTTSSAVISGTTLEIPEEYTIIPTGKTITKTRTLPGGNFDIKIEFPAGVVERQMYMEISVNPVTSPIAIDKNKITEANTKLSAAKSLLDDTITEFILRNYDTGTLNTEEFNNAVKITLSYPDADNNGFIDGIIPSLREDYLRIHMLNEDTNEWQIVGTGGDIDKSGNNVTFEVRHFSVYTLINVLRASADLDNVIVSPNPYKPSDTRYYRSEGIRFINITSNVELCIYNIAGELIFEETIENTGGSYDWPVTNNNGKPVASGIYIYYIRNPDNDSINAIGKLAVIK